MTMTTFSKNEQVASQRCHLVGFCGIGKAPNNAQGELHFTDSLNYVVHRLVYVWRVLPVLVVIKRNKAAIGDAGQKQLQVTHNFIEMVINIYVKKVQLKRLASEPPMQLTSLRVLPEVPNGSVICVCVCGPPLPNIIHISSMLAMEVHLLENLATMAFPPD